MTPGKKWGLTNQQKRSALLEACKARTAVKVIAREESLERSEYIAVSPKVTAAPPLAAPVTQEAQNAVKPAQATIATRPPSTPVQAETFGERALRLFQKATVELPDVAPTVELATTTTDSLVLAACARSTDFDVLVAVYNNPRTPLDVLEKMMEDDRIMQLAIQQSEDRARTAK